jgi:transitional endoplasmic reticulum ATPase
LGVRPARGVIIHGPAGSGKTMIAAAVKTESGVWFRSVNGPEIMSKRSGEAESALREVFEQAEANAPSIIFIDELDVLAPKRDKTQGEMEKRIVSQLLTLLDGMKSNKRVIVLAATSRPGNIDPALRRFGRFDRELALPAPDAAGRLSILQAKTKKVSKAFAFLHACYLLPACLAARTAAVRDRERDLGPDQPLAYIDKPRSAQVRSATNPSLHSPPVQVRMSADANLEQLAEDTHGYSGADLAQLVTEAAMQVSVPNSLQRYVLKHRAPFTVHPHLVSPTTLIRTLPAHTHIHSIIEREQPALIYRAPAASNYSDPRPHPLQCVREKAGLIDVDAEDLEDEMLTSMVVTTNHLNYALARTSPSSLRDKLVEIPDCSWKDVGGLWEVKREMTETLQYPLKYAAKYARYGLSPSKGILLYGPSGCGKTLVAKAIANEVKSNFISVKGPELLSMWFGESESNVRELFDKARGAAPCILFFDEIDSIAKPRGSGGAGGGEAGDRIVNQILTEIDGVGAKKSVFIIAATNRPDMLDSAVMRPGRIDQLVYLPLPDHACRVKIFEACTRRSPLEDDVLLDEYADRTEGFSGADITEICQRACKLAIRQNIEEAAAGRPADEQCAKIARSHFEEAMLTARKSVSAADVKKFERFRQSIKAGK